MMRPALPVLPNLRHYRRALSHSLPSPRVEHLLARAQAHWRALRLERPPLVDSTLQTFHLEQRILPAVALYRSLLADDLSPSAALELTQQAVTAPLDRIRRGSRWLGKLPFFFPLFRLLLRGEIHRGYPSAGWSYQWLEDSPRCMAFNITTCFYLDTLTQLGLPELTPVFCATDDFLADGMSPRLRWARTQTLGRGAACCDFRYERVDP